MGFTVGSGGSSIIAEGAVTADKIADGAVSPEKLDGTGTPGATTYYRGDGAWETPAGGGEPTQHGRYSNAAFGSTNTAIVQFPTAIGTPSTADFTHNAGYATEGSVFTCVSSGWFSFDVVIGLTAGGKGINLIKNSAVSNNVDEGTKLSAETSAGAGYANALSTIRYIESGEVVYVGIGGGGALSDAGAQNISYNRILITRITGPGATGETGPAGPAATDWQTVTQSVGGTNLSLELSPTGDLFEIEAMIISGAESNLLGFEYNGSAGSYTYAGMFGGSAVSASAGDYILPTSIGSGVVVQIGGTAYRSGTTVGVGFDSRCSVGATNGTVYKVIGGATEINTIKIVSNQAAGIAAGSYIKARKIS